MIHRLSSWGAAFGLCLALVASGTASAQVLIGETAAQFTWQTASGNVEFYEVYVSRSSRDSRYELEQTVSASANPTAILDAGVGEVLRVRVRAGNALELGPMSPPSEAVRFGLPPDMPVVGSPGSFFGRVLGCDTQDIFYIVPDSGNVWHFAADDPAAGATLVGSEPDPNWRLTASGDFDGDAIADLFWRNVATGDTRIWFMETNESYEEVPGPLHPGIDWDVLTSGDFDGNGQDDLFWRSALGQTQAWFREEAEFFSSPFPVVPDDTWELLTAGDFDADGLDDLFWRNIRTSDTAIWFMQLADDGRVWARFEMSEKRSTLWEVAESRDDNGDAIEDVRWRLVSNPEVMVWWWMNGSTVESSETP